MKSLTFGKYRGLEKCATEGGRLAILALDHRNNLRRILNPDHPELVDDGQLGDFKLDVVKHLASEGSAVLLDPQVGAFQAIAAGVLKKTGLILALESTGYDGVPSARKSNILEGWTVEKAKRLGSDAVKLLVYYNPESKNASQIESLVNNVAEECEKSDILFILEPLTYSIDPAENKLTGSARQQTIIEAAQRLTKIGGDVLKSEFPIDIGTFPDKSDWMDACSELTQSIDIPWVLLSASVDFDTYLEQVRIASQKGSSGVAVGRAVWKEAIELPSAKRGEFLLNEASARMRGIVEVVEKEAHPYTDFYTAPKADSSAYIYY